MNDIGIDGKSNEERTLDRIEEMLPDFEGHGLEEFLSSVQMYIHRHGRVSEKQYDAVDRIWENWRNRV